jgi:hypothetical protein
MIEDHDMRCGGLTAVRHFIYVVLPYIAARMCGIRASAAGSLL